MSAGSESPEEARCFAVVDISRVYWCWWNFVVFSLLGLEEMLLSKRLGLEVWF